MSYAYRDHLAEGGTRGESHPSYPRYQVAERETAPVRIGALLNWSGAALSLALLAGLGLWSWQLMVRDVSGVPVVRALEGPMRVAPEDVGGLQAQHQGLSVNQIAAGATAAESGGEIVLAPPPVSLRDEDAPLGSALQTHAAAPEVAPARDAEVFEAAWRPETGSGNGESAAVPPPPGSVTAVQRSPRPQARPAALRRPAAASGSGTSQDEDIAMAVASSVAARTGPREGREVDPASLRPGMRLVQLGTFPSEEAAREAWTALAQRFRPHLDDYGRVIEEAHSGGSVFYRLRAHGFADEAESRRFCALLIDQNTDCIPVLLR
ncbi:MAG: SPOR domain-containing protein [Rhodobacteraceae bacterium]|nr:SPOR domain-containing protein [Paracoccaceae bacterium]